MNLLDSLKSIIDPKNASGRQLKAQAIALLIYTLTKTYPRIINYTDYIEIQLTEKQILAAREYFYEILTSKPGEVRIVGTSKILLPELWRKYWPWALGTFTCGYLVGKVL